MTQENIYTAPTAELLPESAEGEFELAGRWARLAAALLDGLILCIVVVPVLYFAGFYEGITEGVQPVLASSVMATLFSFIVWFGINFSALKNNGQTIGKRFLNIRITDLEHQVPPLLTLVGLRYAVFQFLYVVPMVGPFIALVDILMIFGKSRRCLHDRLAKTKVIQA